MNGTIFGEKNEVLLNIKCVLIAKELEITPILDKYWNTREAGYSM